MADRTMNVLLDARRYALVDLTDGELYLVGPDERGLDDGKGRAASWVEAVGKLNEVASVALDAQLGAPGRVPLGPRRIPR